MSEQNPTVQEIVEKFLRENGFDGLFCEDLDCACNLEDLITCQDDCHECEAGYNVPCEDTSEYNFCIGRKKPC